MEYCLHLDRTYLFWWWLSERYWAQRNRMQKVNSADILGEVRSLEQQVVCHIFNTGKLEGALESFAMLKIIRWCINEQVLGCLFSSVHWPPQVKLLMEVPSKMSQLQPGRCTVRLRHTRRANGSGVQSAPLQRWFGCRDGVRNPWSHFVCHLEKRETDWVILRGLTRLIKISYCDTGWSKQLWQEKYDRIKTDVLLQWRVCLCPWCWNDTSLSTTCLWHSFYFCFYHGYVSEKHNRAEVTGRRSGASYATFGEDWWWRVKFSCSSGLDQHCCSFAPITQNLAKCLMSARNAAFEHERRRGVGVGKGCNFPLNELALPSSHWVLKSLKFLWNCCSPEPDAFLSSPPAALSGCPLLFCVSRMRITQLCEVSVYHINVFCCPGRPCSSGCCGREAWL